MNREDFKDIYIKQIYKIKDEYPNKEYYQHFVRQLGIINKPLNHGRLKRGTDAPDFVFKNKKGNLKKLSSYKGNVVYIFFWDNSTFINYFYKLKKIEEDLNTNDFLVLSVAIEKYEDAVKFCQEYDLPWHPIRPVNGMNCDIANLYERLIGENLVGFGVLIDKTGKIREIKKPGFGEFEDKIRRLL